MQGLALEQVSARRGTREVLSGISMHIVPGRMTAVLGANGAGKSTLLALLSGEMAATSGKVMLDGKDLSVMSADSQAQRRGVLPQSAGIVFPMDVATIISMGAYAFTEVSDKDVHALVEQALSEVGMAHACDRQYQQLSGGEQQRIQFARVWVQVMLAVRQHGYAYMLLDEPVSSLDPRYQHGLLALARQLAQTGKVGIVAVLHDVNLAVRWCDELYLLAQGRMLACGAPKDVLEEGMLEQMYGMRPVVMPHPLRKESPLVLFD